MPRKRVSTHISHSLCSGVRAHSNLPTVWNLLFKMEPESFFFFFRQNLKQQLRLSGRASLLVLHTKTLPHFLLTQFYCHFSSKSKLIIFAPFLLFFLLSLFLLLSFKVKVGSYCLFLAWAALPFSFRLFCSDACLLFFFCSCTMIL